MRNKNARIPNIESINTYAGSPIHQILEPRFDGTTTKLVSVGEENIQDYYESQAPLTDINYMLNRLALGDTSVFSSRRPMYGDFTGLPSDPIEALNLVHESERAFAQLSIEEKQKYNNDWKLWFADILSGSKNVSRETLPNSSKAEKSDTSKDEKGVDTGASADSAISA